MSKDETEALEIGDDDELIALASEARLQLKRMLEALLFASAEPLSLSEISARMPDHIDVVALLAQLQKDYADRGVNLIQIENKWLFRTAKDLSFLMQAEALEPKKLSRAALETLAIIAYHQPVTRAEMEQIRGVSTVRGTLDVLLQTEWVRVRGRRRVPGRPVTYGTSDQFLVHFDLESIKDLPGIEELKGAGMLDSALPPAFSMPEPDDNEDLAPDEDPIEDLEALEAVALEDEKP
ncbi:condensin subunit ScpB [Cohaesibacter sp. ES.047]|uniref:SMC-Scp complex subunit ScpB n=1 Tax=Cohaesibacter sp. ES.047 TaxID=1798205 RepID=UPI000BB84D14|nr:SMC-Scp complex subunit ScpB [Cohaesibacter sp. ES.047]SNY93648.1 condensin subunit ScpB [Cohaesibacter sp. ES.047]